MAQEKRSESSSRNLIVGITLVVGLAIGVLAVIAIQSFVPKNELASYDLDENGVRQVSPKNADRNSKARSLSVGQFKEIFKLSSSAEQYKALYNTLSHNTEQELKEWWIQSQKIERTSQREIAQHVLLQNLTKINPQEAFHLLDDVSTLQWAALSTSIFSEWAVLNLDDAIEAVANLGGTQRNIALEAILRARDDLSEDKRRAIAVQLERAGTYDKLNSEKKALQNTIIPSESWDILLNDGVDDSLQIRALALVAETWQGQIGFEVLSKIYHSGIEDYEIKGLLIAAIAQVDPAQALEFARGLSEENEQSYMSHTIVEEWASTDPLAVLAAVSSFKPFSLYFDLEEEIALIWAKNKPIELIQSIELMSEGSRVWPLEVAFAYLAREHPLGAIDSLSSVENYVGNTSTVLHRIVEQWGMIQPEAATNWLLNDFDQEDPVLLHSLLQETLPSLALQDPTKAFEIALEQPTPAHGLATALDLWVIWKLTTKGHIEQAISLLPQARESSQAGAYNNVGTALVRNGQTLEALELGSDLGPQQQQFYYRHVIQEWAKTDPIDLYESLEDLPSSDAQSIAASELLTRRIDNRQRLTDDQRERARSFLNADDRLRVQLIEKFENQ